MAGVGAPFMEMRRTGGQTGEETQRVLLQKGQLLTSLNLSAGSQEKRSYCGYFKYEEF